MSKRYIAIFISFILCIIFTVVSNVSFELSVQEKGDLKNFIFWQIVGNLTGFLSVIAYTYLLTLVPFYIGYALTTAFGQIFVQVFGSKWFFKEEISFSQWIGIILIIIGTLFLVKTK